MRTKLTSTADQFLAGGGEMGERIRNFDWTKTSLGPPALWPQNLKTCIRIILTSSQPMFIWWGKDLINLYNDAYKSIVRGKHPEALGQPAAMVWKEIWDEVDPRINTVINDNIGTYDEALLLIMERNGYPEETYYTFSYSPIAGEDGVDGIICANTDSTERIISERQLRTLRDLGKNIAVSTEKEVYEKSIEVIEQNPQDFPFAMIYQIENGGSAVLCCQTGNINNEKIAPPRFTIDKRSPWWFEHVVNTSAITIAEDLHKYGALPTGPWQQPPHKAIVIPIMQQGHRYPFSILVVGMNPYRLPDENYLSFFQLIADQIASAITAAKALEEERRRAEALSEIDKAKTIFFNNISHEFRTPLTLMLGPLEDMLRHSHEFNNQHKQILETAHRNAMRLLRLVNALLDFSRIESGRIHATFQRTDITAFTTDLASNFRSVIEEAGLILEVQCKKINAPVYVDKEMWEKIVLNLLSNAFKYTLKGKITVLFSEENERAILKVKDTGVGIPAKELPRLFERFYRIQNSRGRSHEGTGIGLSLVNELVKFHQGSITVDSIEGEGTTFTVSIPTGREHLPSSQVSEKETDIFSHTYVAEAINLPQGIVNGHDVNVPALSTSSHIKKGIVLVVDDNADMRNYLSSLLTSEYVVETAANGQEALESIRRQVPDIILSDVIMPVMDGIQLLKKIKEDTSLKIPIILLSARAGEEAKIEGYNIGADDYLVKPFSAKELLARIQSQVKLTGIRKKIDEAEERSRLAIEAADLGSYSMDLKTGGLTYTDRFAELFGFGKTDQLNRQTLLDTIHPEYLVIRQKAHDEAARSGSLNYEAKFIGPDNKTRWLKISGKMFYDEQSSPARLMGAVMDITEQRELQQRKDDFIRMASHELKTPVTSIKGYVQLLLSMLNKTEDGIVNTSPAVFKSSLATIDRQVSKLTRLMSELLDVSKIETGKLELSNESFILNELVADVVQDILYTNTRHNIAITHDYICSVFGDKDRLAQVFINIITNAIKYSPGNNEIDIHIYRSDNKMAAVSIKDYGIGIDLVNQQRIFERFFRVEGKNEQTYPGFGIGLFLAREIIERHDGIITVKSEKGKGAEFITYLPVETKESDNKNNS